MVDNQECQLCFCPVTTPRSILNKPSSFLRSYLYHKNVREALIPSSADSDEKIVDATSVPKLTFTFSCEKATPEICHSEDTNGVQVCEECHQEVTQLDKLHQQLESCKKLITFQVDRIEKRCENSAVVGMKETVVHRNRNLWGKRSQILEGASVTLAGTSVGKSNISQVLRCLGFLCEEEGKPSLVPASVPEDARKSSSLIIKQDQDFNIDVAVPPQTEFIISSIGDQDHGEVGHAEEITHYVNPPKLHHPLTKLETTSQEDIDISDHFVHVKLDLEANDEDAPFGNEQLFQHYPPDEDPLGEVTDPVLSTSSKAVSTKFVSKVIPSTKSMAPNKKIACEICGRVMLPRSLSLHMVQHTGDTPFRCEVCGKKFSRNYHLQDHLRIHTGENKCKMCQRVFTQRSSMFSHMRKVHGVTPKRKVRNEERESEKLSLCRSKRSCDRDFDIT